MSDRVRSGRGATVSESATVDAPVELVWQLVTDVTRMPEFSPELRSARWVSAVAEPKVGARFSGTNKNGRAKWSTSCEVVDVVPQRRFAYRVTYLGLPISEWCFELEPSPTGCVLTESTTDHRHAVVRWITGPATGVTDRATHNRAGIQATLAAIKTTAEREAARS